VTNPARRSGNGFSRFTRRGPTVFDHGRLGPAILFNVLQVGAYMTVVLVVPRASQRRCDSSPSWRSGPGAAKAAHGGSERMLVLAVSFLAVGSPVPVFRARLAGAGRVRLWRVNLNLPTVVPQMRPARAPPLPLDAHDARASGDDD
jgi:hypothetical protein